MKKIGILGNGGQADEIESYLSDETEVMFRAVSAKYLSSNPHLIDIDNAGDYKSSLVIGGVGAPAIRKQLIDAWSGTEYMTLVSGAAYVDSSALIGTGSVIAPKVVITTNVTIGKHSIINIGVTISHDVSIGNFVTISPGAHIAGHVDIGDGVFIGIGASISNGVKVADGCVVGAGAVVLEDITIENCVAVGMPAKVIKTNKGWLSEI